MDPTSIRYAKDVNCVTREIAGETVIVPVRDHVGDLDSIYTLNEVATMVWRLIDGERSVSRIVEAVCEEFEAPEEVEKDVVDFLGSLREAGLIRPAEEGTDLANPGEDART